jgi:hypothetical protein
VSHTTLDLTVVRTLAAEVERQGGVRLDLEDLIRTWERVTRRNGERADLIRAQAAGVAGRFEGDAR